MVNVVRLREAMRERAITYDQAANAIGIDRSTFYRRMERSGSKFTVEEVSRLSKLLNLSSQAMQEIFFDMQLA